MIVSCPWSTFCKFVDDHLALLYFIRSHPTSHFYHCVVQKNPHRRQKYWAKSPKLKHGDKQRLVTYSFWLSKTVWLLSIYFTSSPLNNFEALNGKLISVLHWECLSKVHLEYPLDQLEGDFLPALPQINPLQTNNEPQLEQYHVFRDHRARQSEQSSYLLPQINLSA